MLFFLHEIFGHHNTVIRAQRVEGGFTKTRQCTKCGAIDQSYRISGETEAELVAKYPKVIIED